MTYGWFLNSIAVCSQFQISVQKISLQSLWDKFLSQEFMDVNQGNTISWYTIYLCFSEKQMFIAQTIALFNENFRILQEKQISNLYSNQPSAIALERNSIEILVPVLVQLHSLEDLDPEEHSDTNDADFKNEDDSARKRFHQKFGTIKKDFRTPNINTEWGKKTRLKKEQRYLTFDPERVDFFRTFEVTVDLCIAMS